MGNKFGSCNLSSINLSEYVLDPFTENSRFDYYTFAKDIEVYVQAMDDVLEENLPNHPLKEQAEQASMFRNIGIGVMGVHDVFIKMGYRYGDNNSLSLLSSIMHLLFRSAVFASSNLAEIRGNFPGYDSKIWNSKILKIAFGDDEIIKLRNKNCLRNCSLISIAPTGSIGTMLNVSTGIEPWFSTHYIRNTKSLNGESEKSYEVWAPVVKEAIDRKWHNEVIVTANDINYKDRIAIQSIAQTYVDTAISSTLNLPKTTTPEDIKHIYIESWRKGLKGCTVYVDGSRDPILSTNTSSSNSISKEKPKDKFNFDSIKPISRKVLGTTSGTTACKKCACGTLYITCNRDSNGNLVEVFTHTSKGGICQANMNAVTRLISLNLRSGVAVDEIIDQIKGINCPACNIVKAKGQNIDGLSCPDIISKTINEFINTDICIPQVIVKEKEPINTGLVCPECGASMIKEGGCVQCLSCGYSKCN